MEKYIEVIDSRSKQTLCPLHMFTVIRQGYINGTTILSDGMWFKRVKVPYDHFKTFIESPSQRIFYVGTMEVVQRGDVDWYGG